MARLTCPICLERLPRESRKCACGVDLTAVDDAKIETAIGRISVKPSRGSRPKPLAGKKPSRWYRVEALWDGPAACVSQIGDVDILLQGMLYKTDPKAANEPELAACLVPPSMSESQIRSLNILLTANLRVPVLLLTNNIHLVRMRRITDDEAAKVMRAEKEGGKKEGGEADAQPSGENGAGVGG
jgi:hypothetical protein